MLHKILSLIVQIKGIWASSKYSNTEKKHTLLNNTHIMQCLLLHHSEVLQISNVATWSIRCYFSRKNDQMCTCGSSSWFSWLFFGRKEFSMNQALRGDAWPPASPTASHLFGSCLPRHCWARPVGSFMTCSSLKISVYDLQNCHLPHAPVSPRS